MIATLKQKRREGVKRIGELQKERQSLDVQIAVASTEKRVKITEARRRKIYPLILADLDKGLDFQKVARNLNIRGFRNDGRVWRAAAVETVWREGTL
ncbi:MAG: hypothetical protein WA003_15720 [Desulfuromonadaceae bacterium]